MIQGVSKSVKKNSINFFYENDELILQLPQGIQTLFDGTYLQTTWMTDEQGNLALLAGLGNKRLDPIQVKEVCSKVIKECKDKNVFDLAINIDPLIKEGNLLVVRDITEGLILGTYEQKTFYNRDEKLDNVSFSMDLYPVSEDKNDEVNKYISETTSVTNGVMFARDMVNLPGNKLRPTDFAKQIIEFVSNEDIETELIEADQLREMKMDALLGVGDSSAYPPCLLILRYKGDAQSTEITGLIGKGVTCDTGGYCLKPSNSMLGIKGDMAGGAAVASAVYALAKNHKKTNVVAVIPMCENRISPGSLLPGDVISSYSGKTIEIANTDAEGRLILGDAVSYAVRNEGVTEILDIATLTGAVVSMLGFSIGGIICDNNTLYNKFEHAFKESGERYLRVPFYQEHEKMIKSQIADVRNLGESYCGTITAGLFIRAFAENTPWIHLDIAGTAWVDQPVFEFQSKGATGAAVTSIYYLCCREA